MSYRNNKIRFFNNGLRFSLLKRKQFKAFLEKILSQEGKRLETINYVFCSDEELRKLNKEYLNHDYFTDILTFDLSTTSKLSADIFISISRIRENSKNLNQPFHMELKRVMIHGLLHLCGYKDKTANQIKKMRQLEDKYLLAYSRFM